MSWVYFSVPTSYQYPIHLIDQQLWWVQWPPQSASLEDWPVAFYLTSVCLGAGSRQIWQMTRKTMVTIKKEANIRDHHLNNDNASRQRKPKTFFWNGDEFQPFQHLKDQKIPANTDSSCVVTVLHTASTVHDLVSPPAQTTPPFATGRNQGTLMWDVTKCAAIAACTIAWQETEGIWRKCWTARGP